MSGADVGKMTGLMGKRKLTTMQVAKQLSAAQSSKEIATPRQVGARNDRWAWRWINQAATKIWGRDLQEQVSSLVLSVAGEASPNLAYCLVYPTGHGSPSLRGTIVPKQSRRGMRLPRPDPDSSGGLAMTALTIPAHGTLSTGRVMVGRGRWTTPQIFLGWSEKK